MSRTSPFRAWWAQRPPAAGAVVMATGIVSVALRLTGYEVLSGIAFAVACAVWLGLAVSFTARLLWERERWLAEAGTPGSLTAVAATAVLGTRFSVAGRQTVAEALLALATVLWPWLLVRVTRQWRGRMPGTVFLGCVATESLAVTAATIAAAESAAWLAHAALVLFWLGLVLYGFALARFEWRQVITGAGDHWIVGGALSVSALAGAKLISADSASLYLWNFDDRGVLRAVTVALLVLDLAWCVVLLAAEAVWPRLRFDVRRWSTVFPLGMTAATTLSVGTAMDVPGLRTPGQVMLWIAVAAWLVVAAGTVRYYVAATAAIRSTEPR
ncbi:tellurite resistance/C4-dicarboxylate transporter family protein [Streptomyces sp. NBC_00365]|uniref:tellurite resistance/C4-dicarboxylate transporter family protein n=1 Tax=Streptomyces sp. NBC_00365 TaxID=2975726 RepID=UPI00225868AB|nr:tellurite resistance/C4-dicarboxylate transporter family protein [Streptomyces sp. NBC_00365]MCX5092319.1 tellurite resistance/C4-dicarboxylate transporter family protein [Streptomyces sp. NBC_00365]